MLNNYGNMFDEHIYHVRNYIQKPFKMGILDHAEHVCKMFDMSNLLPPLIRKNDDYHEYTWYTRLMPYNEVILRKSIKYRLNIVMQEEVEEKDSDYCIITP